MQFIGLILSLIFFVLAIIHFYWAFGGKWGFDQALPTNEKGEKIIAPGPVECAIVGIGLILFGLFYPHQLNFIQTTLPEWIFQWGGWLIPSIFTLRGIGDFNYCGLFKKVKTTKFGRIDTKLYTPLCLLLAVLGFLFQVFNT